jgi:hypothetical protein
MLFSTDRLRHLKNTDDKTAFLIQLTATQLFGFLSCLSAVYLIVHSQPWLGGGLFIVGYFFFTRPWNSTPGAKRPKDFATYEGWLCLKTAELLDRGAGPYPGFASGVPALPGMKGQELIFAFVLGASIHADSDQVQSLLAQSEEGTIDIDGEPYIPSNAVGKLLFSVALNPTANGLPLKEWIVEGRQWILRPSPGPQSENADAPART